MRGLGGGGVSFEDALFDVLPRGVDGKVAEMPRSRHLTVEELHAPRWAFKRGSSILLGYRLGRPISFQQEKDGSYVPDDRHLMTIAGSRAGKGVSLIIPNLLLYENSVLAIDPKGELSRITTRARRAMGQQVHILDPFATNGRYPSASFNPLAEIDPASPSAVDEAGLIADGLIEHNPHGERYWTDSAQNVLRGLLLLVLSFPASERHLGTVRDLLTLVHSDLRAMAGQHKVSEEVALLAWLHGIKGVPNADVISAAGSQLRDMGEKERGSVLSTARTQTRWLDSPAIRATLTRSDFKLSDLKSKKTTVFLCLPGSNMATHAAWLRMIVSMSVTMMEQVKSPNTVLFVLDEAHVLGNMRSIEMSAGLMAGYGVKLWTILQDLSQLKKSYPETWETFIGNAGVLTCFGNTDDTTLGYISERSGRMGMMVSVPTGATVSQKLSGASGQQEQLQSEPLLAKHEIERLYNRETGRMLVLAAGQPPATVLRVRYYAEKPFEGLWDK